MKKTTTMTERLAREANHGHAILETNESNWGWDTPSGKIRWKRRLNYLADHKATSSAKVLEIGCGTGTFTVGLQDTYTDLTALDISPVLLEKAKGRCRTHVKFVSGDAHKLPFGNESFDVVLGCSVLHHLDWTLALKDMYRVLRPGGKILFSEPNLLNPQIFLQKNWPWLKKKLGDSPDEYAFTRKQITRSLKQAGFDNIQVRPYEFLHPSTPKILIGSLTILENLIQKTPIQEIAGSLKIMALKP